MEQASGQYEVLVEGKIHPWDKEAITTSEIRSLGELPSDRPVVEMDLTSGKEKPIDEGQVHQLVALQEGKGLTRQFPPRRGRPRREGHGLASGLS